MSSVHLNHRAGQRPPPPPVLPPVVIREAPPKMPPTVGTQGRSANEIINRKISNTYKYVSFFSHHKDASTSTCSTSFGNH